MTIIPTRGLAPTYAHPGDAGADLRALQPSTIMPGAFVTIRTGTAVAIPAGHFGLVAGRSGLGVKHGIALVNGIGVIDSGYRGELLVGLINHGREAFQVRAGDRVAQLLIVPFVTGSFLAADALEESERGEGGFGSTGSGS